MMQSKLLLRIAAGCLLFFATGHSIGHFTRHEVTDPQAKEIIQLMTEYQFDMFGTMRSYDENYTGMSLNLLITLAALITLIWILSNEVDHHRNLAKHLLIPIAACVAGFSVTSFLYFFPLPAITCLAASACLLLVIIKSSID